MPKKQFFLRLLLSCLWITKLNAQQADDPINTYGFNERFLEHLIKEQIDSVRTAHQLKTLYNDSILYVAAKYHAEYLCQLKDLNHNETDRPKTLTPQKRAEYFGAVNYLVGENIAFTLVNAPTFSKKVKKHVNTTYRQVAQDLAIMWVNSPGHYKNMIYPDYNATGVAVWSDPKLNRIYAVQKFANILFKYQFDENKNFFAYSNYTVAPVANSFEGVSRQLHSGKHVHKLKTAKKTSQCAECLANSDFQFGLSSIEAKNGKIIFSSYDYYAVLNLLQKRKDGFAVEIIPYKPYDCGNPAYYTDPSRRNGQCVFSGKVLKPVYKKKAIKGFRSGTKRKKILKKIEAGKIKKFQVVLGKLPKDITSFSELNLVLIQKKRVCRVMRFSGYCGDTLERFYPLPIYQTTLSELSELKEDYKNVRFRIPFQKGKTEYNMKDIKPLTDSLLSESFTADSVIIKAFSSVEGSEKVNKAIQEKRAQQLVTALAKNQKEKLNTYLVTEENWELFETQIKTKEQLKEYRNLSKDKVKALLEDTVRQKKVESFLAEQRVADIRLRAREIITDKNAESFLTRKIQEKESRIRKLESNSQKTKEFELCLDSMKLLMGSAFSYIRRGTIRPEFFKKFNLGSAARFDDYNELRLIYKVQLDSTVFQNVEKARDLYTDAVALYNNKRQSFLIDYITQAAIQLYGKEMNVETSSEQTEAYISEIRNLAKDTLQQRLTDLLEINHWFKVCRLTKEETPKKELVLHSICLSKIHAYFASKPLSQTEKNKIAYYYVYHSRPDWAMELLWPDFQNQVNNPEGYTILAKILCTNYQETQDDSYFEFLKEVHHRIGTEKWCPMFIGPCNISFQVLDYEPFRNFYCEKCGQYLNYAKKPFEEAKK